MSQVCHALHHMSCWLQEAALEKAKAGEGRNVEHVALEDDATLAVADTQRPKRAQRKRKQAQSADQNGTAPSAEPKETAKPRRAKQKKTEQAVEKKVAQSEPKTEVVQQTKQASRRGRSRAAKAPLPAGEARLTLHLCLMQAFCSCYSCLWGGKPMPPHLEGPWP